MPLSNEQFNRVLEIFQERRRSAQKLRDERVKEAYGRLPGLKDCEEKRLSLQMEKARALLAGDREGAAALEQAALRQSVRKRELLEEAGLPGDWLEVPVRCRLCGDTGFVNGEKCRCFRQAEVELFSRDSAMQAALQKENFGTFSYRWFDDTRPLPELNGKTVRENMRGHVRTAKNFVARFPAEPHSLLMTGPVGTGKTFLCHAIADALLREGVPVLSLSAPEYFDRMAQAAFGSGEGGSFEEVMAGAELLILADLGMETTNTFVRTCLLRTVNDRLIKERPTIISTNLRLSEIAERYMERVASRILGGYKVMVFAGSDIRSLKRSGS